MRLEKFDYHYAAGGNEGERLERVGFGFHPLADGRDWHDGWNQENMHIARDNFKRLRDLCDDMLLGEPFKCEREDDHSDSPEASRIGYVYRCHTGSARFLYATVHFTIGKPQLFSGNRNENNMAWNRGDDAHHLADYHRQLDDIRSGRVSSSKNFRDDMENRILEADRRKLEPRDPTETLEDADEIDKLSIDAVFHLTHAGNIAAMDAVLDFPEIRIEHQTAQPAIDDLRRLLHKASENFKEIDLLVKLSNLLGLESDSK